MKTATTRKGKPITKEEGILYVALELGKMKWRVGSTTGLGQKPRQVWIRGGDRVGLRKEIERAKQRFGLSQAAQVRSCYEAGRDGFWLHRFLMQWGVQNHVVDSSSIEVNRRARRAKTDRLDVEKLLRLLIRYGLGENKVWSVVHVPSVQERGPKATSPRAFEFEKGAHPSAQSDAGVAFFARHRARRMWEGLC